MKKSLERVLTKDIDPYRKRARVAEVDILRGIPIFLVVLYHTCYDILQVPGLVSNWYEVIAKHPQFYYFYRWVYELMSSEIMHNYLVPFFAGMFLFACGISCSLSKNNWKRAIYLSACSLIISLGTMILSYLLNYNLFIGWGILHIMAFSVIVYALIESIFKLFKKKAPAWLFLLVGCLVFFTGLLLRDGVTIGDTTITWPTQYIRGTIFTWLDDDPLAYLYSALGIYGNTVDWWPIFPWFGLIFIGAAFGIALYGEEKTTRIKVLDSPVFKPLRFIGGHTMWVYIFHQPVIIIVLGVICLALGFRL